MTFIIRKRAWAFPLHSLSMVNLLMEGIPCTVRFVHVHLTVQKPEFILMDTHNWEGSLIRFMTPPSVVLPVDGRWVNPVKWDARNFKSHDLDGIPIYLYYTCTVGKGRELENSIYFQEGRIMEATNVRSPKVLMYRSGSAAAAAAARDRRVSFGITISPTFSYQPPIGLHKQKKKKKKEEEVSQRVSTFEWVMIRRNLNLISLRRFGGAAADNKGIPELLVLLGDPKQQQQQHHLGCVGEESSTGMGDEEVKLIKQEEENGSIEEEEKKTEQGEDLGGTPLKSSASPPEPPEKPLPGDCCGNGCIPCVWDTYNDELEDYNKLLKAYNSQFKP